MRVPPEQDAGMLFPSILESYAFMFCDPAEAAEAPPPPGGGVWIRLALGGTLKGAIELAASRDTAAEMAANVLGLDPQDPQLGARAEDTIREFVSVLAGHVAGDDPGVSLGPPELFPMDADAWERLRREPGTACFRVEDRPAMFRIAVGRGR